MIIVNGKEEKRYNNLEELVNALKYNKKNIAILVNDKIVKKEKWKDFKLKDNDKIEIVGFVGGG